MNKVIILLLFGLVGFAANGQQRFPSGFPTQLNTGWNRWGYAMSDSGLIVANRDTTWFPKFSGTVVFRPTNKQFYWFDSTNLRWNLFGTNIDTTSISNRINLKLNISDTTGKWLVQSTRLVDTVYRVNDSTVGYTIKGTPYTFQILGRASAGGGSGTVTSVALSMPSAFSVLGSPITTSGTFNISGAGTTAQYIRGNGTLATTDTGMIPNFHLKVRSLFTGSSPITFNQTTGVIGINNATASGTKGAASFTSSFSDNGSGLIDLADLVSNGSCTGCNLNINSKGQITGYSDGAGGGINNVNIGAGFRPVNAITQEMRTYFAGFGQQLDSVANANGLTWSADTTRGTGLPTYFYVDSIGSRNISNTSLTADGNYAQNWNNKQLVVDSIAGQFLFKMGGIGSTGTRRKEFKINWGGSSFGNNLDGYNILATIRKADNSADSLTLGLMSSGTGVLSMGSYDVANSSNNTFISYNANSGLINISAKDSLWIKGAVPAATADSILGVIFRSPGVSKIVKIPTPTGAGIPALAYKNVAYGGIGNVMSTGDASFQYDSIINELTVDSTSAIQHRASYVTLNPISRVDSVDGFGDSFMNRANTTSNDSAFLDRSANFVETAVKEHGVSGSGIYYATALNLQIMSPLHNGIVLFMSGFNTLRQNNILNGLSGRKTQNAIIWGYKSVFANHFLKSYVGAGSGSVTRTGSWFAPWDATAATGKSTSGTFTSSPGAYYEYTFVDSTVIIGLIGQNDAVQAGSTYNIYIDNVLVISGSTSDKADGIYDGFSDNGNHIAMAEIITGLTYASHTVKVENTGSGVFIADYVGHLRPASLAPQLLQYNIPYMKMAGYAGGASNPARTDTMNVRLDSLYATYPVAYKSSAFMIPVNSCYDTATGTDADNIHPDDVGHRQIFECGLIALSGGDYPEGSIYYGTGYPYFKDAFGSNKIIVGEGRQGYLNKFGSRSNKVEESIIQDDGIRVGVGQTPGTYTFSVAGTMRSTEDALFATSSGNVGIGTTAPNFKLDVNGFGNFQGNVSSRGSSAGYSLESRSSGTYAWGLYADNSSLKILTNQGNYDRVKFWNRGGVTIGNATETSATDIGSTLDVHGSVRISKDSVDVINSISSQYVLVLDTINGVDSNKVKRILASNLGGGATTIYNGDGILSANRTVTGSNNSLTFNTISNYRINSHTLILDQQTTGFPYVASVLAANPHNYQLGYTSAATPTVYTKGAGLYIDTNNNAGLGASIPTTVPLYTTGNSAYAVGFQSAGGNFYAVGAKTANYTVAVTDNFITIDATGGNVTLTLPAASTCFGGNVGIDYVFKRLDNSGNSITIQRAGSDTIDGATSFTLTTQWEAKKLRCLSTSTWGVY